MYAEDNNKVKAAYTLNMWTVSISQIVEYNDLNVLEQEYNNIINNLNLENIPKDEALLEVIQAIMDEITHLRMDEGDRVIADKQYQQRLKNAVWNAIPNVGAIFATSDPIAMGVTLATQVGIGYMNYRRNKAEINVGHEEKKWQIEKNRMQHLHGLQKQLFETAWRLADTYQYPDEYRLSQEQITEYNTALMEPNAIRRFNRLSYMKDKFTAYPHFWYQLGSVANYICRNAEKLGVDEESRKRYYNEAIDSFEEYKKINTVSILRKDVFTSSWALEYLELLNINKNNDIEHGLDLIKQAERFSGDTPDVLELCAFAYLRLQKENEAIKLFHHLVDLKYNLAMNTQILSALYIRQMNSGNKELEDNARFGYNQLPLIAPREYIIPPPSDMDLSSWKPDWIRNEDINVILEKHDAKKKADDEIKDKAHSFYIKPCCIVYSSDLNSEAEKFKEIIEDTISRCHWSLSNPIKIDIKEYTEKKSNYENGYRIILLGESKEAKSFYKNTSDNDWAYNKYGIKFKTFGSITVILTSTHKVDSIDLADYAARKTRLGWDIPLIEKMSTKEMKKVQYRLAIYEYLKANDALIIDNK